MKTIHISLQRYKFLLRQGYAFRLGYVERDSLITPFSQTYRHGDTVFHLLGDEHGVCDECGGDFDSVDVNGPAELETLKMCDTPEKAIVALRDMRQSTLEHYKDLCLRAA